MIQPGESGRADCRAAEALIQKSLFELQDEKYKRFQCRLLPTILPEAVIGVRTPALRRLAKKLAKTPEAEAFLQILPHRYYDENNLHGFLIESIKEYDTCIAALNAFLPYVDNWATCDLMSPKVLRNHLNELAEQIRIWLASDQVYTIRFGIGMLIRYYLGDMFEPEHPELVASVQSQEYYVNMAVAWYFSAALAEQYDAVLPFIEQRRLDIWTHNKAIQKAVESGRMTEEQKAYLKMRKRKE